MNPATAARVRWLAPALSVLVLAACAGPMEPVGSDRCYPRAGTAQCITQPPRHLALLSDNFPVILRVDARGVILQRGARYRIKVTKVIEPWSDGGLSAGADLAGSSTGAFSWAGGFSRYWARAPEHPMYALMGAQGREKRSFFVVGPERELTAASGEELLFFANDWPGEYDDNHGCLELEVEKISP
jgi:hypothetical protein